VELTSGKAGAVSAATVARLRRVRSAVGNLMGEYEDRYPDAYGHGEASEPSAVERHFAGVGLPRQVRDPPSHEMPAERVRAPAPRQVARPAAAAVGRSARDICDDIYERLKESPFIDATGVSVAVSGSEATLDGTINSLIAVSLARALALNVAGVGAVQVRLKVQPPPRRYETGPPVEEG
jgi:BON domain-containing protein